MTRRWNEIQLHSHYKGILHSWHVTVSHNTKQCAVYTKITRNISSQNDINAPSRLWMSKDWGAHAVQPLAYSADARWGHAVARCQLGHGADLHSTFEWFWSMIQLGSAPVESAWRRGWNQITLQLGRHYIGRLQFVERRYIILQKWC